MLGECVEGCPEALAPADGSKICRECASVNSSTPHWDAESQKCTDCTGYSGKRRLKGLVCMPCDYTKSMTPYWDEEEGACKSCKDAFGDS